MSSGCIKASLASQLVETVAYVFTDIPFLDRDSPYFFCLKWLIYFFILHLKFLTSHICFHLDDCDKPHQSLIERWMMERICNLETGELQEIPQGLPNVL